MHPPGFGPVCLDTVRLQLPRHDDLHRWLDKPEAERLDGYRPPVRLRLCGSQHHQQPLLDALGTQRRTVVPGQLFPRPVLSGRHAGSYYARVLLDGEVIGVVPAGDLLSAPAVAEALRRGPVDCYVLMVRYPARVWAKVLVS